MTPKTFDYVAPASLQEAIGFLARSQGAKVIAGGQSLLALMKLRLAAPELLVDIGRIHGLSYIREDGEQLLIGALTTQDTIDRSQVVGGFLPVLADAARVTGDQQVRNRGTIGGSACHADPSADLPTALLASDARFVIQGPNGSRVVEARGFFVDWFTTAVGHDEILTEVRLPRPPPRAGSAYVKHSVREADFAIAMAGAVLSLDDGKRCKGASIAVGAAGPTPIRVAEAERYLLGKTLDQATLREAAERAVELADPRGDTHGSREYRLEMTKVVARRALELASSRVR